MQHNTNLAQQLFISHFTATDMNNDSILKAKEIFETYKRAKVILSGEFDNNMILSILVYTLFSRMFDLMQRPVVNHSIVGA